MTEHPYCLEHDQPLDWCDHPEPDDAYWAEIRAAMGKGTRSILWGTSNRALDKAVEKMRAASGGSGQPARPRQGHDPFKVTVAYYDAAGNCVGSDGHTFMPPGRATHYQVIQEVLKPSGCAVPDTCPQCGEADLVPEGAKHRCPVCSYIQPCCNP